MRRDGAEQTIPVTPSRQGETGRIGINISDAVESFTPSPLQAVGMSVQRNIEMSGMIFRTLADLFRGEASPRQLMGPVGIAQLSGESAQAGWIALFGLMASLSLNLGLLNLLPIPVLDGGHIFIMAIETLVRRDFSLAVKEKMLFAGFVALMALMVTVIYNDLTRIAWIERLMPGGSALGPSQLRSVERRVSAPGDQPVHQRRHRRPLGRHVHPNPRRGPRRRPRADRATTVRRQQVGDWSDPRRFQRTPGPCWRS